MPGAAIGAMAGMIGGGLFASSPVWAVGGLYGGLSMTGAMIGTQIGMGYDAQKKLKGVKMPGQPTTEFPKTTVEEIDAQEQGWGQIMKRAQGRRSTILTQPQLSQTPSNVQRATLLAG